MEGDSYGKVSGKEPTRGTSLNVVSILLQEWAPRGAQVFCDKNDSPAPMFNSLLAASPGELTIGLGSTL